MEKAHYNPYHSKLLTYLEHLSPATPSKVDGLLVLPLLSRADPQARGALDSMILSLDQGIASRQVRVEEVGLEGDVGNVHVINQARLILMLVDGEELIGAKQNRIVNSTILVPPESQVRVPVSCVERQRWSYRSREFSTSDRVYAASSRGTKSASISMRLDRGEGYSSVQGEVWSEVDQMSHCTRVHSVTSAMSDIWDVKRPDMDKIFQQIAPQEGEVGVAVWLKDRFIGLDAMATPDIFQRYRKKILNSYIMDSVMLANQRPRGLLIDIGTLLREARKAEWKGFQPPGAGVDIRFQSPTIAGNALVSDELVHLSLFPKGRQGEEGDQPGEEVPPDGASRSSGLSRTLRKIWRRGG